jgi:hypothetical protein
MYRVVFASAYADSANSRAAHSGRYTNSKGQVVDAVAVFPNGEK